MIIPILVILSTYIFTIIFVIWIQQVEQHPTLGKAAKNALTEFGRLMADLTNAMDELALPDSPLDHHHEVSGRKGLHQEIEGSVAGDLDRRVHRGQRRDDDDHGPAAESL